MNRFLVEAARRTRPFFEALTQDHFFLGCCLIGSYVVIQVLGNQLTGRAPLCSSGPGCPFPSVEFLLIGLVMILGASLKRLTDLEVARIQRELRQ